jgi:Xaa-Pro aminopeptidase
MAFDPAEGWTDFRVPVSTAERVWEGAQAEAGGRDIAHLPNWLQTRSDRPIAVVGATCPWQGDDDRSQQVCRQLLHLRRPKDEQEVSLLEKAVTATAGGFAKLQEWIRPGATEREVGIRLESEFFLNGAQRTGYGTIVGAGPHSAVLHWPPTSTAMAPGQVVLVDAGGCIDDYTADVTRVFAVDGLWDSRQNELYQLLLQAQIRAVAGCQVGIEWGDLHVRTALELSEGLAQLGLLRVSPEEAVDSEAIALFFPHGLGHMLGLGVRDASGLAPGRTQSRKFAGATLRMDLPLQPGYVVTVEPGLYFIPALLNDPVKRAQHAHRVAWERLDPWMELGGMRIEDNLLITQSGPRNLTSAIAK